MPTLKQEFGSMLRHYRERAGLTQSELAERINRSIEMVGRMERGTAAPSFDTLQVLSAVLATPIRDFFGAGAHATTGKRGDKLGAVVTKLAALSPEDLARVDKLIDLAVKNRS